MNERMAMLTSTSRINLRSCTMPVSRPASISRTATSGSTPGRRSSSQSQSETSSQPRQVEHAVDAYQHVVIRMSCLSDLVMKSFGSCRSLRPSISRSRQHRIIDENGISYRGLFHQPHLGYTVL